jgi:hypothetical protein
VARVSPGSALRVRGVLPANAGKSFRLLPSVGKMKALLGRKLVTIFRFRAVLLFSIPGQSLAQTADSVGCAKKAETNARKKNERKNKIKK